MKKILGLTIAIVLVIGLVAGGTWALFSDTETSGQNVFEAGTIDIAIDGQNPWTGSFTIDDMKPCETGYITFVIQNVGTNPVVVWKHLIVDSYDGGLLSEPEAVAQGGVFPDPGTEKCDIGTVIEYDLSVLVNVSGSNMGDPAGSGWWQLIYDKDILISDVACNDILLGMIPVGGTMEVTQSYHMEADTGNWAQGDIMNFTIEIYGEQQKGSLTLENKSGDPDWKILLGDGIGATLSYNTMGPTFDYTLSATGLANNTSYSLIYYADPWPGSNGCLIDTMMSDGSGAISTSGSVELNMDLPGAADNNFPHGAKVWLVLSSDYSGGMTAWNPGSYLFDIALMTYNDTDV